MSKTEDYLDSLLNDVSSGKKTGAKQKKRGRINTDFIEDFEKELNDADMEDFIREFEIEVDTEDDEAFLEDSFFDNLEGIIKKAKEDDKLQEEEVEATGETFEVNTLEDDAWTEQQEEAEEPELMIGESETEEEQQTELEKMPEEEDQEMANLLAGLSADNELSELDELLGINDEDHMTEEVSSDEVEAVTAVKVEKKGFFRKLISALFGDEEEEKEKENPKAASHKMSFGSEDLSNMSDENLQILQELNAAEQVGKDSAAETEEKRNDKRSKKEKKEQAKKAKKEKKAQEKKEKQQKEKKTKKEKKPKKPKEVDLSPPLPKKPVILIFVMAASAMVLVMLASSLLGYSVSISDAKAAYAKQNYVESYHKVAGLAVKEEDAVFYEKVLLLAKVQSEMNNGNALYESKQYAMALDSYICALGRCDAGYNEAVAYDLQKEFDLLMKQITTQLTEKYGVSVESAREIYGLADRTAYTKRIYEILDGLGLTE